MTRTKRSKPSRLVSLALGALLPYALLGAPAIALDGPQTTSEAVPCGDDIPQSTILPDRLSFIAKTWPKPLSDEDDVDQASHELEPEVLGATIAAALAQLFVAQAGEDFVCEPCAIEDACFLAVKSWSNLEMLHSFVELADRIELRVELRATASAQVHCTACEEVAAGQQSQ